MPSASIQDKLGWTSRDDATERKLDEAIAQSFPASDPVSMAQPHDPADAGVRHSRYSQTTWFILGGGLLAAIAFIALRR
jgi:hypothetical protein